MDDKLFAEMWNNKESAKDICKIFGISGKTSQRIRDRLGLTKRPLGGVHKNYTEKYPHTKESAYLMGVALGDGSISKLLRTLRLELFCDSKYPNLIEKWRKTCELVFGNRATVRDNHIGKCKEVHVHSNKLREFPWKPRMGKKCDQGVSIPQWIKDEGFLKECILGLLETDGCDYIQRVKVKSVVYEYRRFAFCNSSMGLIEDVKSFLDDNGVTYSCHDRKKGSRGMIGNKAVTSRRINTFIQIIDRNGKFVELMGLQGPLKA